MTDKRPAGGLTFDAVFFTPEGWVVLSPWITTPDGCWFREIIRAPGHGDDAERWAKHIAAEMNKGY